MSKKRNNFLEKYTPAQALAFAIQAYEDQGFVRSREGYQKYDTDGNPTVYIDDNKTVILNRMTAGDQSDESYTTTAEEIIEKFNGKLMVKKLTGKLTNFEKGVTDSFVKPLSNFSVAVIASIPHMNEVDKKRSIVEDRLELLKFKSEYFAEPKTRHEIEVEVLDVKYIQSSNIYMITAVHNNKDVLKFWWRDQPDLSDIIDGKMIKICGTVNKHEIGKYSGCMETMLNRVKIISN